MLPASLALSFSLGHWLYRCRRRPTPAPEGGVRAGAGRHLRGVMLHVLLLLLCTGSSGAAQHQQQLSGGAQLQLVPATHDSVRWQGRTLRDGRTGTVAYSWAGVSFSFNVSGGNTTTVAMQFSSGFPNTHLKPCTGAAPACGFAGLHVYIDGLLKKNLTLPMGAASWPNNTGTTTWITLLDDFQCGASSCAVQGIYIADPITLSWPNLPAFDRQTTHAFRVGGGGVSVAAITPQPPVNKQQRRIDIYGDSITAGNQINPETCDHDWSGTYGKLLCEDFGANCTCQAISGKGIYHNCCDNSVTMNVIGLNILPGESSRRRFSVTRESAEAACMLATEHCLRPRCEISQATPRRR